ncbi:hypothetical protein [Actinoplanes friuliensis]|uniref:Uncharacterized protein n=1 Tax=Actinoplanes friuliensis DSM 7358 TaxID=1246995 RepID=U5WC47_9ACTN|nr:hypothetical protein [Actinoplanes friuliensis]AGZ46719.1 hypothetical protein AFR_42325 [Actinoplanes friuliensis DSM 7358]
MKEGLIVTVPLDPEEGATHAFAQVVGFLPVGGVLVVHPETSAGVYAPEDLTVQDPRSVPPAILAAIVKRTSIQPLG